VTLANVCNLYLVRLSARQHEMALLACLGADPRRRLRLAAMETLAIGASGTMAGFALYPLGLSLLRHFDLLPTDVPQPIAIDAAVLVYTLLLAAIAVAAMLACAIRFAGRSDKVYEALKQGGTRQTASRATQRVRRSLIVAQIALTATLLTGTGLLLRSAQRLLAQDVGFDREHIVLAPVYFEPDQLDEKETDRVYRAILQSLLERAAALPGVDAAGLGARTPFDGENIETNFEPPQRSAADSGAAQHAKSYSNVGPGFFAALGLPLVAGRAFSTDEVNNNDPNIVVVDDFFAHHYFPDGDALGQTFRLQNPEGGPRQTHAVRIVGVTVATRGNTLDEALDRPTIYEPGNHNNTIILHTRIDPAALNRSLRNLLHDISPKAEFGDITTMRARIASTLDERTRLNTLLALLGAIALALAAIGLYAVLAYSVRQRWGEFGVRMALGATSLRVLREVLLHGVRLVGIGLIVGLPLAYAFAQMLSAQLYRIDSLDPTTLIAVAALLVSIGLAASWLPARNAARVDPITALRQE
jgi:predicted permease